jgi:hypothetical protein
MEGVFYNRDERKCITVSVRGAETREKYHRERSRERIIFPHHGNRSPNGELNSTLVWLP